MEATLLPLLLMSAAQILRVPTAVTTVVYGTDAVCSYYYYCHCDCVLHVSTAVTTAVCCAGAVCPFCHYCRMLHRCCVSLLALQYCCRLLHRCCVSILSLFSLAAQMLRVLRWLKETIDRPDFRHTGTISRKRKLSTKKSRAS